MEGESFAVIMKCYTSNKLNSNDICYFNPLLGSVDLCGLKFVQTRGGLIAARGLQPSGLSQNRVTKSKSPLGRTLRAAPVWH